MQSFGGLGQALASTGKMRAAINLGNPIVALREPSSGKPRGVSVNLASELALRLGLPLKLQPFDAAAKVVEALKADTVDEAFLAIDPARALDICFTRPYVLIEGAYLVRRDFRIHCQEDVDRPGVRIVAGSGSAYDLYLSREIKSATLVRAATFPTVTDTFIEQDVEVAAGVRQQLEADTRRVPGLRLLGGHFMVIKQAMATPRSRNAAAGYLSAFIEEMKRAGFIARSERNGFVGARVAPPECG